MTIIIVIIEICDNCHVYKSKCGCPRMCDTCNKLATRENLCECGQEYVKFLAAKIGKAVGEPQLSTPDISDKHCE